ncbi:MAG: oligopeptide ABC transporter permease OppB [Devosia sp.]|jgi:oligopeptide transport system permease protein|uniref:oligopeptide ABC transporter permease OppB n=1 Tax=unclassified Devosia TaxID=196773 RepID=UPI00092CB417|nr:MULTISPECIES: oligopeptide ABC transporter permease OppB [unclassified Devosia]MBL8598793.1 oligopeptide ABC transporter permease OppB [Devosia sp.]MBN9345148.1 oligopeptide ABC transporter permease OppB [Devosia sp.]OJX52627.1 MAG: oligopeptide transporter permease [Devosia sp. 66-22]
MIAFILKRLAVAIPTLLVLIILSFILMKVAPGSPFSGEKAIPETVMKNILARYGLDKPQWQQLLEYIYNIIFRFDFGPSFVYRDRTVNDIIAQGFPVTVKYGFFAFIFATVIGVAMGIFAAIRHNSWGDYLAVGFTVGAQVVPNFVLAPILVLVFTLWLRWLPGGGWNDGQWNYVVLPVIALATSYVANIARIMRSSMLEVLHSNFIRTARAKGMPGWQVIVKHALKPAMLPVVSYLGPVFVGMITGSVVIDLFFSTGGIGQWFVNSALGRDYSTILGITILLGALTIAANLVVDILYAWIDPKIRY